VGVGVRTVIRPRLLRFRWPAETSITFSVTRGDDGGVERRMTRMSGKGDRESCVRSMGMLGKLEDSFNSVFVSLLYLRMIIMNCVTD